MARLIWAALCAAALVAPASAQYGGGVNIDFNGTTGAGAGQPTILLVGAVGQGGYWNPLNPPYTVGVARTIRNPANSLDAVTLVVESTGSTAGFAFNNANTTGDADLLFDDIHDIGSTAPTVYSIGPFNGGVYDVCTYAVAPDSSSAMTGVRVYTSSTGPGAAQLVGGVIPASGAFTQGVTHALHRVAVAHGERIYIQAQGSGSFGSVNGIQIKPVAGVTRLYVKQDAPAAGQTGLSWASACTSLQRALSVAADTPSVSEIWLTRGLHYPDDGVLFSAGDRDATFKVTSNLTLTGRFVGTEATPADRAPGGPATQLNGRNLARHVVTLTGASGVTFADLNINDGNDERPFSPTNLGGGGASISGSSVTFSQVRFGGHVVAGVGACLSVSAGSNVTINDCDTSRCQAGAAVFLHQVASNVTINRSMIANQLSTDPILGVFAVRGGSGVLTLNNVCVANNQSWSWLLYAGPLVSVNVYNCTIANNRSTGSLDVGLHIENGGTLRNSIVYGNASDLGAPGFSGVINGEFVNISDNLIQGWNEAFRPGFMNFDADPRFTFPVAAGLLGAGEVLGAGRYGLASRSPARDSGWNGAAPAGTDCNRNPRIVDDPYFPNSGFAGGTVDRGCYEAQAASTPCPGDLGTTGGVPGPNGVRDNNDFVVFIDYFFTLNPLADVGRTGGVPGSDGVFDNNDFVVFIDQFFTVCP